MTAIKDRTFNNLEELKIDYIKRLNEYYPCKDSKDSIFGYTITAKYVILKCQVCKKYQLWFDYTGDPGRPESIKNVKFKRAIN